MLNRFYGPSNLQFLCVQGHRLAYERYGYGKPVLLVHGFATHRFIWSPVVAGLKDRFEVVAVDLLGWGDSDKPLATDYSIKHQADMLCEFIQQFGWPKCHLVGHDVGGGVAQLMAISNADLFYDVTLINAVGYDYWPVQPVVAIRTPIVRQIILATFDSPAFKTLLRRGLHDKNALTSEVLACFQKPLSTSRGRKAMVHFANCLCNSQLMQIEADLQTLALPVLIIRGDADLYLGSRICERLHADIPDSRLIRIATGGHFIQLDEPELLANHMTSFFDRKTYAAETQSYTS